MIQGEDLDIVIYHYPCWDGLTAAWICKKAHPHAMYIPQDYNTTIDIEKLRDKCVLMVDYCPPRDVLNDVISVVKRLTILDHHKGVSDLLKGLSHPNVHVVFDLAQSGAGLVWEYAFKNKPKEPVVLHVEDRDLWLFNDVNTRTYCAALDKYPLTFDTLDTVAKIPYDVMLREGQSVVDFLMETARKIGERAFKAYTPKGTAVLVVNGTKELASDIGEYLNGTCPDLPAVIWYHDVYGYRISFRSSDTAPISALELSKEFEGGGHEKAAGALIARSPGEWRRADG